MSSHCRPAPGESLIRIHATSLNFHDLIRIAGQLHNLKGAPRTIFRCCRGSYNRRPTVLPDFAKGTGSTRDFSHYGRRAHQTVTRNQLTTWALSTAVYRHIFALGSPRLRLLPSTCPIRKGLPLHCAGLTPWRSLVVEAQSCPGPNGCSARHGWSVTLCTATSSQMTGRTW